MSCTHSGATWPTGACWRAKNAWVHKSWVCHDCYTRPWLYRSKDRIDDLLRQRQQLQESRVRCRQGLIVFAPIVAGPDQKAHSLWLHRFYQHEPCVVRLLADAVHGVYRNTIDIAFPSQLKPQMHERFGELAPLRGPRAHLLGFQGSAINANEAVTPVEQRHLVRMRQEVIKLLKQEGNSTEFALRLVPKDLNTTEAATASFLDAMNSTFCLVLRGSSCYTWRLLECLFFGSIPVIIEDEFILPFSELLKCASAS